jgi:hypothetical protein
VTRARQFPPRDKERFQAQARSFPFAEPATGLHIAPASFPSSTGNFCEKFTHRLPLALLLDLLSCVPARARNVECPVVWPGESSKSKVKDAAVYINDQTEPPWDESRHGTRVKDVVYGEFIDLQCRYANRRILLIPLHGEDPAGVPFGGRRIASKRAV